MPDKFLSFQILTPNGKATGKDVKMVVANTSVGEVGVLPLHAPYIATIPVGHVRLSYGENEYKYYAVSDGYIEVKEDIITVLARTAESAGEIDVERAKNAKERAEKELAELSVNDEKYYEAETSLNRAINRLKTKEKEDKT